MSAALAGQLAVVVILLGWYPAYRYLRPVFVRRRLRRLIRKWNSYTYQRDHSIALEIDKAWNRTYGRAQLIKAYESDIQSTRKADAQAFVKAANDRDNVFQDRYRAAEALGFLDSFEDEPKRIA